MAATSLYGAFGLEREKVRRHAVKSDTALNSGRIFEERTSASYKEHSAQPKRVDTRADGGRKSFFNFSLRKGKGGEARSWIEPRRATRACRHLDEVASARTSDVRLLLRARPCIIGDDEQRSHRQPSGSPTQARICCISLEIPAAVFRSYPPFHAFPLRPSRRGGDVESPAAHDSL